MENSANQTNINENVGSKEININKQIFLDRPIGKITVGKLLVICSFINMAVLFLLFFFSGLVCLHVFNNVAFGQEAFWKLPINGETSYLNATGIISVIFDVVFLLTALILQTYIWKYKIDLKKKFWKKIFWTLILVTFLFMLFGLSDNGNRPWICVVPNGDVYYGKSGGWYLVLFIYIGILVYLLFILLAGVLPHKVKNKVSKLVRKNKQENDTKPNE